MVNFDAVNGATTVPVKVYIENAPATSVTLNLIVNTECGTEVCNSEDLVTLNPNKLIYEPWADSRSFTISVDN